MARMYVLASLAAVFLTPVAAASQIPDEFTNLQLLSEDIAREQLVGTMRNWADGLGVRCNYCHVGPDDLVGADFASDEKPTKRTARRMLELSRAVNGPLLDDLPTVDGGRHQIVSCYTCHRGLARPPRHIGIELGSIYTDNGVNAVLAEYRRLRAEHFAAGRYDFSERQLVELARVLVDNGNATDAVALLRMGLEFYPQSADLNATMSIAFTSAGQLNEAQGALDAALALDPDNRTGRVAQQQLERAMDLQRGR